MSRNFIQGSSQKLTAASSSLSAVPLTLFAWVKPNLSGGTAGILQISDGSNNNHFGIQFAAEGAG